MNLVVNNVGGSVFAACVRSLAFQGRLATVGYLDDVLKAEIDIEALHAKRLALFGVSNRLRSAEQKSRIRARFQRRYTPDDCRRPHPAAGRPGFAFDELPAAKAYMEANAHLGKIVVRMQDS